jgi:predicted kinase/phosphoglycolate phosphatase-like HAD superfamily hydrolase
VDKKTASLIVSFLACAYTSGVEAQVIRGIAPLEGGVHFSASAVTALAAPPLIGPVTAAVPALSLPVAAAALSVPSAQSLPAAPAAASADISGRISRVSPALSSIDDAAERIAPSRAPQTDSAAQGASPQDLFFRRLYDAAAVQPQLAAEPVAVPAAPRTIGHSYQPQALAALLDRVSAAAAAGRTPIVLFDIDDTLVDSGGRTLRILREFLNQPEIRRLYPDESKRLLPRLSLENMRFHFSDTAEEAGIFNKSFVEQFGKFWSARFYRDDYLPEDPANPGAVDFVKAVVARGGTAVYFTGRWEDMRPGTEIALRRNGFPEPDGRRVILAMKPDRAEADDAFKARELPRLGKLGLVVGGFENEPPNVNIFKRQFPSALMIFLNTRSAGQKDPATRQPVAADPSIPWIGDFTPKLDRRGVEKAIDALDKPAEARRQARAVLAAIDESGGRARSLMDRHRTKALAEYLTDLATVFPDESPAEILAWMDRQNDARPRGPDPAAAAFFSSPLRDGRPRFVELVGYPASGKSTYLRALETLPAADRNRWIVVNLDSIREELTGHQGDLSRENDVMTEARRRLSAAINAGKSVVLDATNLDERRAQFTLEARRSAWRHTAEAVSFEMPPEAAFRNALSRAARGELIIPQRVYDHMAGIYRAPRQGSVDPARLGKIPRYVVNGKSDPARYKVWLRYMKQADRFDVVERIPFSPVQNARQPDRQ